MEEEENNGDGGEVEEFEIVEYEEVEEGQAEENDYFENQGETDSEYASAEENGEMEEGTDKHVTFDTTLPSTHSYLSHDWDELSGRTLHEDDMVISIPILSFPGVVLMPGQLLPLHLFRNADIAMIKYCLDHDRTFGQLNILSAPREEGGNGVVHSLSSVGTTVEILAVKEDEHSIDMKVKTVGRQRFEVLSKRVDVTGNIIATVRIIADKLLLDPLTTLHYPTAYSYLQAKHHPQYCGEGADNGDDKNETVDEDNDSKNVQSEMSYEKNKNITELNTNNVVHDDDDNDAHQTISSSTRHKTDNIYNDHNNDTKSGLDDHFNQQTSRARNETLLFQKSSSSSFSKKKRPYLYSPALLTHWPEWVYNQYNCDLLMRHIRREMRAWNDEMVTSRAPLDPETFSFWVASCLPIEDLKRVRLLAMQSVQQRLRFELHIIKKCTVMCCNGCKSIVAKKEDVFSMSCVGPLGTYVNPGGHVHETLTVHHVSNLRHVGRSSTEASWFPGYAWTIVQCERCGKHMGWRFTVAAREANVQPSKFWGLCRTALVPALTECDVEGDTECSGWYGL